MKLIVGLGNIGKEYECTRHNVGFMAIDEFAINNNVTFKLDTKLKGLIAELFIDGKKTILLKPTTFMNLSGEALALVMKYYKINQDDILVISDDLSMETGKIRLRSSGSAGGHNGLKSIIANLGNDKFHRVKIGISKSDRIEVVDYVLGKFTSNERQSLDPSIDKVSNIIVDFINDLSFEKLMNKYNG